MRCLSTHTKDYTSPTYETSSSVRAKSKLGFLENLNAKLAEQRLSGKAFAVRNIINSKALVSAHQQPHPNIPLIDELSHHWLLPVLFRLILFPHLFCLILFIYFFFLTPKMR